MLLSFLLWLSIGGLYDLPLISYALSSDTLPVGTYESREHRMKLVIEENNICVVHVRIPQGWCLAYFDARVREEYGGYNCYKDPSEMRTVAPAELRILLGLPHNEAFTPSLVAIYHSTNGEVWIRRLDSKVIPLTLQEQVQEEPKQQAKGDNPTPSKVQERAGERGRRNRRGITPGRTTAVNKQQGVKSTERTNVEQPSSSLGDGEDLLARAMREAGLNEEASLEYGESPTPPKHRRLWGGSEAKSMIDGAASPQPGEDPSRNDMTANSKGASGDSSNVKELDYTKPSSSRTTMEKDEDIKAEGRGDVKSKASSLTDWPQFDGTELEDLIRELEEEAVPGDSTAPGGNTDADSPSYDHDLLMLDEPTLNELFNAWKEH
ncbi:hypothetical protein FOL47_004166 [Perkinsus chesapeaki]|uniref:Uncharacterized protein n=1 Tax=Perkinsus chesapeaki TaxID=330153 RepID=A0A7J6M431_PERCH|nr:hypothetical protein FOL47_004166 [Perkinsus chesapeaki]